ncbi:MAG: cardiolipin synthase ClsB [Deltaproteobacteria bacterium]|nr:cardiolipin synthase ClsB [Deltaproteobacteria bacterium]
MQELATSEWVGVGENRVRLLRDGAQALPAMLAAVSEARSEVVAEFYWWASDRTGTKFRDALAERARAGVKVRAIYDSVGSLWVEDSFFEPLRDAGAQVVEYHPVSPTSPRFRLDRIFMRDHRKLLVVDGSIGFTGGVNLGDPWAPEAWGGDNWRDDAVQVQGPAAQELRAIFYETWRRCGLRAPPDLVRLEKQPTMDAWVLANRSSLGSRRQIRQFYLSKIQRARQRIDIANAYFVPDRRVRRAIVQAAQRGVEVRILIPERNDQAIVQAAMEHLAASMTRKGVKFWTYPDRMMHGKLAVIDGSFVTVGSYNLDHLSLRYNLECNLAVLDEVFARQVRASFEEDLAKSSRLDVGALRRSPWRRALGWLAYQIRAVL